MRNRGERGSRILGASRRRRREERREAEDRGGKVGVFFVVVAAEASTLSVEVMEEKEAKSEGGAQKNEMKEKEGEEVKEIDNDEGKEKVEIESEKEGNKVGEDGKKEEEGDKEKTLVEGEQVAKVTEPEAGKETNVIEKPAVNDEINNAKTSNDAMPAEKATTENDRLATKENTNGISTDVGVSDQAALTEKVDKDNASAAAGGTAAKSASPKEAVKQETGPQIVEASVNQQQQVAASGQRGLNTIFLEAQIGLKDQQTSVEEKVKLITKIRESLETVYGAEYGLFLKEYVPIFINLLKTVPKQTVDNVEHKLRNAVLEVLIRLLNTEHIVPFLPEILNIMMTTLETDSEDNALLCLRGLFELHKAFRASNPDLLEREAKPFIAFALRIYMNFNTTAAFLLDEKRATAEAANAAARKAEKYSSGKVNEPGSKTSGEKDMDVDVEITGNPNNETAMDVDHESKDDLRSPLDLKAIEAKNSTVSNPAISENVQSLVNRVDSLSQNTLNDSKAIRDMVKDTPLIPSTSSFIILKECPSTITFLFQLYQKLIKENVPKLLGPMVVAIGISGPQPVPAVLASAHAEMKDAQVKALCFLTYLLKSFASELRPYQNAITNAIVNLLKTCPDGASVRKELLNAARHFISDSHELVSDFRTGLYQYIETLMREDVLVGKSGICYDTLRPLAYNLLAELVHHVRNELNMTQITSVIYIYSRNLHDSSLPISMQTTSARLLLNLVMCLRNFSSKLMVRDLLLRILDAYVSKLSTMRFQMKRIAVLLKMKIPVPEQQKTTGGTSTSQAPSNEVDKAKTGPASKDQKPAVSAQTTSATLPAATADPSTATTTAPTTATEPSQAPGPTPTPATTAPTPAIIAPVSGPDSKVSVDVEAKQASQNPSAKIVIPAEKTSEIQKDEKKEEKHPASTAETGQTTKPARREPVPRSDGLTDPTKDYNDCRYLIRSLFSGLKAIISELASTVAKINASTKSTNVQDQDSQNPLNDVMLSPIEMKRIVGILPHGVSCLMYFSDQDCQELLEIMADMLITIPLKNMHEAFSAKIGYLHRALSAKPVIISLPIHLIHNRVSLPHFGDVLVKFLMEGHLQDLRDHSATNATIVLRLFHVLFTAVAKMPENEVILRMHIAPLVQYCLSALDELDKAAGYIQLLRSLFRSLAIQKRDAARKTDILYREFGRVLQPCIATLLSLLNGPEAHAFRPHIVELLLTLPADLSSLLPDLSRLMPPLVLSLNASQPELVQHGLRTLEVWVDSLNPEFLEPAMAPVEAELLRSLWSHLKPYPPFGLGLKALQLLGKLGGRSRRFFHEPLKLDCKENPEHGLRLMLTFEPSTSFLVPLDRCINLARARVFSAGGDLYYRRQALTFLQVCLSSVINLRGSLEEQLLVGNVQRIPQISAPQTMIAGKIKAALLNPQQTSRTRPVSSTRESYGSKTKTQLLAERSLFKSLVIAVIAASADDELQALDSEWDERKTPSREFVLSVCRHFALLYAMRASKKDPVKITNTQYQGHSGVSAGQMIGLQTPTSNSSAATHNASKNASRESALKELEPSIFLDALVESLSSTSVAITAVALQGLKILLDTLTMVSDMRTAAGVPNTEGIALCIDELLPRLLHCSFNHTWGSMRGGVAGLRLTVKTMPAEMLRKWQCKILRAYLGVIRHHPSRANGDSDVVSGIREVLQKIPPDVQEVTSHDLQNGTLELLARELVASGSKPLVKNQLEICFNLLAEQKGKTSSELMVLFHKRFLQNLMQKPLRMKPLESQIEMVSAITYCLGLQPSIVPLSNEILGLVNDALGFANQEREVSSKLINPHQTCNVGRLNLACMELLNAFVAWDQFTRSQVPAHIELRNRIISAFFRGLTSANSSVVSISKEGLRTVVRQRNLPKDLLHASIRPILVNLANHTQFTLSLLQGLGRLLELLSGWFNVTLGSKLMEHLKRWLDPEKLRRETKSWKPGEDIKIAAAILDVFHLLPPAASNLVEQIIQLTCQLEAVLPHNIGGSAKSPYLLPLAKYLAKYPNISTEYFLKNLNDDGLFNKYGDLIRLPESEPLRSELKKRSTTLIEILKAGPPTQISTNYSARGYSQNVSLPIHNQYIRIIKLVRVTTKAAPEWLSEQPELFECLKLCWQSPMRLERVSYEQYLSLVEAKESKWLAKCILAYVNRHHEEYHVIMDLLSVFSLRTRIDFSFVKDYLRDDLSINWSLTTRKKILQDFLNLYLSRAEKKIPESFLVTSLQHLILPMINESFQEGDGSQLVDSDSVKVIVTKLLDPGEDVTASHSEALRVILLQLATLLIRFMPQYLIDYRRQLIKFGWNHLKREETTSKLWAFINVCHFLDKYQAPDKIILQVFVALLRTSQADSKVLVRQALDIITPALPARLSEEDNTRFPTWIRYTKKMLVEECHSLPNLVHIFHLIVKHSDLFYSSRAHFLPYIVNSFSKFGMPNSPIENRRLAIDLAGLVIRWEQKHITEMNGDDTETNDAKLGQKRGRESSTNTDTKRDVKVSKLESGSAAPILPTSSTQKLSLGGNNEKAIQNSEAVNHEAAQMRSLVLNFLVKMTFISATEGKDRESHTLNKQTFNYVANAMKIWPNVFIKLDYLGRLLAPGGSAGVMGGSRPGESDERTKSSMLWTAIVLVSRALDLQGVFFLKSNAFQIMALIEPALQSNSEQPLTSLSKILAKAFEVAPKETNEKSNEGELIKRIQMLLKTILENYLSGQTNLTFGAANSNASADQKSKSLKISKGISFAMDTLRGIREMPQYSDFYDKLSPTIVKCLQRLAKEHDVNTKASTQQGDGGNSSSSNRNDQSTKLEFGSTIYNLASALSLITAKAMQTQDQKKIVMSSVSLMLQDPRSTPGRVLIAVIQLVLRWVGGKVTNSKEVKELVTIVNGLVKVYLKSSGSLGSDYERGMHRLLLTLCSPSLGGNVVGPSLRKEIFDKVERHYLIGLRARHPATRRAFFKLHNESVGHTLFERLEYIITNQDWECLSDTFWLKQALDFLLAILVEREPVSLAPSSALIPPLSMLTTNSTLPGNSAAMSISNGKQGEQANKSKGTGIDSILERHAYFLEKESSLKVSALTKPLRELAHADPQIAYSMWVLVFPIVWATLDKEKQVQLAKPLISLLSKEYHQRQQIHRPNVVQALLEGISLSQPQPKIPSEVIRFLGKTYNAWHIAIPLLESHVMLFPQDNRCFDALTHIYRLLNEDDMHAGLWRRRCHAPETRAALSLSQHGLWSEAQDILYRVIEKNSKSSKAFPKSELCLWEELWINSCRQLGQWNILNEFSKAVDHPDVSMDTLWRVNDWQRLKEVVLPKAQVDEGPKQSVIRAYSALHEGGLQEANRCIEHGIQSAMQRWWQIPEHSLREREPLLKSFQLLVEAQESMRILHEIRNSQKTQAPNAVSFNGLKETLETWRLRTPNTWDSLSDWMDVSLWRAEVYNFVIQAFKAYEKINPQLHQMGYHGKAWTVNKLAQIARTLNHPEVALEILNKMYGYNTMELQEAVVKICEQAKTYLSMESSTDKWNGLNVINALNLEFFPKEHKAEIFRLKGELLWALSDVDGANAAFSTALSLHQHLPEGWLSWGAFCDECYSNTSKPEWLEYATTCYLQAALHSGKASRPALTKVLSSLAFTSNKTTVQMVVSKYVDKLPVWLWLTWIPQLLQSLQRTEGVIAKNILTRIAISYPQSLYYLLRRYLLERRHDILQQQQGQQQKHQQQSQSKVSDGMNAEQIAALAPNSIAGVQQGQVNVPHIVASFDFAKEIMEKLRQQHAHLAAEVEVFLTELGSRFLPSPEERLLAVIYALIHRCYKFPALTTERVPQALRDELSGVCRACFSQDTVIKHGAFVAQYKESFETDLKPSGSQVGTDFVQNDNFPNTLQELINRLKEWRELLQNNIEESQSSPMRLEEESIALLELVFLEIEIPGQYLEEAIEPPQPDRLVKLERIGGDIDIIRRQGASFRRLQMIGSDGSKRSFLVQTSLSTSARSDERILQLLRVANRLLDSHNDSKRRHLKFYCPVVIPVWPQVRIIFEDTSTTTYYEAYDINCARHGRDPDDPIMLFKGKLNAAVHKSPEYILKLRQDAYSYIAEKMVNDSVFNQYMYKILPTCNHLWAFKRYFASQLALSGVICHSFKIGGRAPTKILFSKSTGNLTHTDFHPTFDQAGIIDCPEPVPFRLTRNLNTFLTPFGVEGMFVASVAAASRALIQPKTAFDHYLALYFRDEVNAWFTKPRGQNANQSSTQGAQNIAVTSNSDEETLKRQAQANVEEVFGRMRGMVEGGSSLKSRQLSSTFVSNEADEVASDIHQPIISLVERALNPENLCKMDPMWHPWL